MQRTSRLFSFAFFVAFASGSWAQSTSPATPAPAEAAPTIPIVTKAAVGQQNMKLVYGSSNWNLDSTKADSAFLFMRDKTSGKIVKILLEETEPDSSVFSGSFAVTWGQGSIDPQIFIPPKEMRNNDEAVKKFNQMLTAGSIAAKPTAVRVESSGLRTFDVYDTKDQAAKAQEAFKAEQKAKDQQVKKPAKPLLKDQELEVAKRVEQQALLNKLAIEAAQREADRVRLEQIERQKILERQKAADALSEKERQARKKQAEEFAAIAMKHYQAGEFAKAEENFKKSVELDPKEKSYYFRYGVTLYRTEKFNDALVVMKLAPDDAVTSLEKKYYMGLIYLRLKELDSALALMKEVGHAPKSEVAASAAFYEGVILFTKEDYEASKEPFERVIDTSSDPRLDEQAEEYLDKLVGLIQQKKLMSRRFFINGMIGTMYDSNVLYAPDTETSQGASTKEGDIRLQTSADAEYRPIFTNTHELGAKVAAYSLISSKNDVSRADPYLGNFSLPYTYKGKALGKGVKAGFKPAGELVLMDADDNGNQELVLQSIILNMDTTFVMKKNWFSNYSLELRNDDSRTADSTGDNNADAIKTSLKTSQTFLLDKAMKEGLVANLGYVLNQAAGKEKSYIRYEIGVTYLKPVLKDATWNFGLSYYQLKYDQGSTGREDKNTGLNTGLTKPVYEWLSWNVTGSYATNTSSLSNYTYSRYTLMASAIFNTSL